MSSRRRAAPPPTPPTPKSPTPLSFAGLLDDFSRVTAKDIGAPGRRDKSPARRAWEDRYKAYEEENDKVARSAKISEMVANMLLDKSPKVNKDMGKTYFEMFLKNFRSNLDAIAIDDNELRLEAFEKYLEKCKKTMAEERLAAYTRSTAYRWRDGWIVWGLKIKLIILCTIVVQVVVAAYLSQNPASQDYWLLQAIRYVAGPKMAEAFRTLQAAQNSKTGRALHEVIKAVYTITTGEPLFTECLNYLPELPDRGGEFQPLTGPSTVPDQDLQWLGGGPEVATSHCSTSVAANDADVHRPTRSRTMDIGEIANSSTSNDTANTQKMKDSIGPMLALLDDIRPASDATGILPKYDDGQVRIEELLGVDSNTAIDFVRSSFDLSTERGSQNLVDLCDLCVVFDARSTDELLCAMASNAEILPDEVQDAVALLWLRRHRLKETGVL